MRFGHIILSVNASYHGKQKSQVYCLGLKSHTSVSVLKIRSGNRDNLGINFHIPAYQQGVVGWCDGTG